MSWLPLAGPLVKVTVSRAPKVGQARLGSRVPLASNAIRPYPRRVPGPLASNATLSPLGAAVAVPDTCAEIGIRAKGGPAGVRAAATVAVAESPESGMTAANAGAMVAVS